MVKFRRSMVLMVCFALLTAVTGYAASDKDASEKKETTGQYVDVSVITTRVMTAIFKEESL